MSQEFGNQGNSFGLILCGSAIKRKSLFIVFSSEVSLTAFGSLRPLFRYRSRLRIWTSRPYFKDNPNEAILKEDTSDYVRKSVGNALRDISKKFPELIEAELNNWNLESKEINNPDASVGVCCSHKVVAVGFNTLRYDASVGVLNPPHE